MNITTATVYALQGCKIYRSAWVDKQTSEMHTILHVKDECFYCENDLYILSPEDCGADDWELNCKSL